MRAAAACAGESWGAFTLRRGQVSLYSGLVGDHDSEGGERRRLHPGFYHYVRPDAQGVRCAASRDSSACLSAGCAFEGYAGFAGLLSKRIDPVEVFFMFDNGAYF